MRTIRKAIGGRLLDADDEGADFIVSTAAPDRDGDTVDQDALWWSDFDNNPVATLTHNTETIPVGRWENRRRTTALDPATGEEVDATVMRFVYNRNTQVGKEVAASIRDGFLNASSVSFIPEEPGPRNKSGGTDYSGQRLAVTEVAVCAVGSNQGATRLAKICKAYLDDEHVAEDEEGDPRDEPGYDDAIGLAFDSDEGTDDGANEEGDERPIKLSPRAERALRKFLEESELAEFNREDRQLLEKLCNAANSLDRREKRACRALGKAWGLSSSELDYLFK